MSCRCAFNNPVASTVIIPYSAGWKQVLLAKRAKEPYKGSYDTIGGYMQAGETPEQAAFREIQEETGIRTTMIELVRIIPATSVWEDEEFATLEFIYILPLSSTAAFQAQDDVAALEWHDPRNLPEIALPGPRQALALIKNLYGLD